MDNLETLDAQLAMILGNLKKLGDTNSEQLPSLEKRVQDQICALLDAEAPVREGWRKLCKLFWWDQATELSGSAVKGAMIARCFQQNEDWNEIEIDIMYNKFTIPQGVSHLLEPVEDKPGFVRLPLCQELCSAGFCSYYTENILGDSKNTKSSLDEIPNYISPCLIRNEFKDIHDTYMSHIRSLIDSFHGDLPIFKTSASETETTLELKIDGAGPFAHCSIDFVPAARLLFWSHQSKAGSHHNASGPHKAPSKV